MNRMINRTVLSTALVVLMCATMMAPAVAQEPTSPFVIHGHVYNSDGDPCNDPSVRIMNTNTSTGWDATNNSTSNYYQLVLDSDDVNESDLLQVNISGCSESKTVNHTGTQDEIYDGLFMVVDPVIVSCNITGYPQDEFGPGETVYVKGTGLAPDTEYKIWIQDDPVGEGEELNGTEDLSVSQETVSTDMDGSFEPQLIWSSIPAGSPKNYDIVVDNLDGTYNEASDGIDSASTEVGFTAPIPELPGVVLVSIGLLGLAGLVWRRKDE